MAFPLNTEKCSVWECPNAACGRTLSNETRATALLVGGAGRDNHLQVGGTVQLNAIYFEPALVGGGIYHNILASQPAFIWSSSNTAVATVSSSALVTGSGQGFCTITASADGASGTFNIGVALGPATASCINGQTITLGPNALPTGCSVVKWGAGNPAAYVFGGTLESIGCAIRSSKPGTNATAITGI